MIEGIQELGDLVGGGLPQLAVHVHGQIVRCLRARIRMPRLQPGDELLHRLVLHRAGGGRAAAVRMQGLWGENCAACTAAHRSIPKLSPVRARTGLD